MVVKTNMDLHTRKKYIDDLIKSGIYKKLIHKLYKEVNEDTLEITALYNSLLPVHLQ